MGIIAEFTTPASTFAVGRAIPEDSGLVVELERIVPTHETVIPFFWVWGDDVADFEARLADEPGVAVDRPIARTERGALYRIEWDSSMSETIRGIFELDYTLLSGEADADRWRFEIRFPDGDAASRFQRYLVEHGIPHELTRVQGVRELSPVGASGLTEKQRETLVAAYDEGYFSVPRETTTRELAGRLGIAPSSVSDRLRRGMERLVEESLIAERELREADPPPPESPR